jgi:hypothetical protein
VSTLWGVAGTRDALADCARHHRSVRVTGFVHSALPFPDGGRRSAALVRHMGGMKVIPRPTAAMLFIRGRPVARVIWMFTGNTYARWDKFIPVHRSPSAMGCGTTVKFLPVRLRKTAGFSSATNPVAAPRRTSSCSVCTSSEVRLPPDGCVASMPPAGSLVDAFVRSGLRAVCSAGICISPGGAHHIVDVACCSVSLVSITSYSGPVLMSYGSSENGYDGVHLLRLQVRAAGGISSTPATGFIPTGAGQADE